MKKEERSNKFQPEPARQEIEKLKSRTWGWVPRIQLLAAFSLITQGTYIGFTDQSWKGYLHNALVFGVIYWLIYEGQQYVWNEKDRVDRKLDDLERRLTAFICDVGTGSVEGKDLKRLAYATSVLSLKSHE